MDKNEQPKNQDKRNEKWRIQMNRCQVEQLDDLKWDFRTTRKALVECMVEYVMQDTERFKEFFNEQKANATNC